MTVVASHFLFASPQFRLTELLTMLIDDTHHHIDLSPVMIDQGPQVAEARSEGSACSQQRDSSCTPSPGHSDAWKQLSWC
jgi:hypothetical protein